MSQTKIDGLEIIISVYCVPSVSYLFNGFQRDKQFFRNRIMPLVELNQMYLYSDFHIADCFKATL